MHFWFFKKRVPSRSISHYWHIFQEICIFIKKHNGYISNQNVQKGDVYLPDFYYYDIDHHVARLAFTLPKSNHLQNLLTPKDNLLNETTPETDLFSSNVFKLPQEALVKTATENYIKKNGWLYKWKLPFVR